METDRSEAVFRHTHLLGTVIEVRLRASDPDVLAVADRAIVDEIVRLEGVFSAYDEHSELRRWTRDEVGEPSDELVAVLAAAHEWQIRSSGAFNPMSAVVADLWRRAEHDDRLPSSDELERVAASIAAPRFEVDGGTVRRVADCTALNLNAIAKGFIVDRVCEQAMATGDVSSIVISAGGDMVHRGEAMARVGIENPLRPYDNEAPLTVIDLVDAGLATSGGARRGFVVGGRRFSHVIDPRSGFPVDAQASISVVAPDAMTADVLATVLGMTAPAAAVEASEGFPGCACLVIGTDRSRWPNRTWIDRYGDPSPTTRA